MADRYYGVTVAVRIDAEPERVKRLNNPDFSIYLDFHTKPEDKVTEVDAHGNHMVCDDSDYADYAIRTLLQQFQELGDTNGVIVYDIPCSHDCTECADIEHGRVI